MEITIKIDDEFLIERGFSEKDIKLIIGANLYNNGVGGTSYIARVLGLERDELKYGMGKFGGIFFNVSIEEYKRDLEDARKYKRKDLNTDKTE